VSSLKSIFFNVSINILYILRSLIFGNFGDIDEDLGDFDFLEVPDFLEDAEVDLFNEPTEDAEAYLFNEPTDEEDLDLLGEPDYLSFAYSNLAFYL
jgi:hypothetical protein